MLLSIELDIFYKSFTNFSYVQNIILKKSFFSKVSIRFNLHKRNTVKETVLTAI